MAKTKTKRRNSKWYYQNGHSSLIECKYDDIIGNSKDRQRKRKLCCVRERQSLRVFLKENGIVKNKPFNKDEEFR